MSVIAWDGKTLAADRRACIGGLVRTTTKIRRGRMRALLGYSGDADAGEELAAWWEAGADPGAFPAAQRARDSFGATLLVIEAGGILTYERTPYPVRFHRQLFAIGSGRDFALAAMHLGKNAAEAVGVACHFDSSCGNGVDTLALEWVEL